MGFSYPINLPDFRVLPSPIFYFTSDNQTPETINDEIIVQSGRDFVRDQAYMELALEELQEVRKERNLYYDQLSDCKRRELFNSIQFEKLKSFLGTSLDEFEARFALEGKCDSPEIAIWYMGAAKYMEQFGRKENRVEDVQNWFDKE